MKLDNPILTAYALGELSPAEQAELEQQIRADREIAAEVEETREIARLLRANLANETAGELFEAQRDAIFREAQLAQDHRASGAAPPANEVFSPLIVPKSTWWDRPGPWQAIAACAVAGLAAYALLMNLGGGRPNGTMADSGDVLVQVPIDGSQGASVSAGPNLISPENATGNMNSAGLPGTPKVNVLSPEIHYAANTVESPAAAGQPGRKGPRVVGANGDAELAGRRAAASIGRSEKNRAAGLDEQLAAHLKTRLSDAADFQPGTSYEDFAKVFQPVPGAPGRYEMIGVPMIKVDAEFSTVNGQQGLSAESRLQRVSKLYVEQD